MSKEVPVIDEKYNNFLFIGEAGCGKSEIAVNIAKQLVDSGNKKVHFFDMDMTKPLFRSRDLSRSFTELGIDFHYEEQFMDAPTLVGGVSRFLKDEETYVVMDAGGDYIGARSIGGFAPLINRGDTMVYYVINPYRPWSYDLERIDKVLSEILSVSHIDIDKLHLISNPNIGCYTNEIEVLEGNKKLTELIMPYKELDFVCVRDELFDKVKNKLDIPVMPLHLYLTYPWVVSMESV